MADNVYESGDYTRISTSTLITDSTAAIIGIGCATASATPSFTVFDSASATIVGSTPVIQGPTTPVSGTFVPIPARAKNGIFVATSGTVDLTIFWQPRS